jgi:ribonuclease P protein component
VPARKVGRIQTRSAFRELQRSRTRASCGPVRATFVPVAPEVPGVYPQVGYAIGKHCGNAVVRNSLRRRMRESARAIAPTLPRGAYLLRVEPAAATLRSDAFVADVQRALQRAAASTQGQVQP